jgi:deoxyribonuclease-1-like protein
LGIIRKFFRRILVVVVLFGALGVAALGKLGFIDLGFIDLGFIDLGFIDSGFIDSGTSPNTPGVSLPAPAEKPQNEILLASFNIQIFGQAKYKNTNVSKVLAQVMRRFDIIAVQEIRSINEPLLPKFIELVNQNDAAYGYVISPPLGKSKEQFAFIFDTTRIEVVPGSAFTMDDPGKLIHREPLVTSFKTKSIEEGKEPFSFTLINVHTDPDETDTELNVLDDVFSIIKAQSEDDVILLGDLNVDYKKFGQLAEVKNLQWTVADVTTNTRKTKSYDNILFDRESTKEFTGKSGVFDLESEFKITREQALQVSDHLPIWAAFKNTEAPSGILATKPNTTEHH